MIYLAPYSAERHGVSQAPHTILGIRNGKSLSNLGVVEVPIKWPVQGEANSNEVISDLTEKLKAFAPPGYTVIGGDHSITLAVLRSLVYHYLEPVYLVMYDAHTDDYYSSGVVNSGNWLKVAYEEGLIAGLVFDDGNRGDVLDGVISLEEIPPNAPVHITVDIDVLSPTEIGWATPYSVMGGYSLEELVDDLMASADVLSGNKRITADFVEYDPALDHARIGGHAAAMVVETLLDIVP